MLIRKMSETAQKNRPKKFLFYLLGIFLLISGVTLILVWWPDVVRLFRGAGGIFLALVGLLILYAQKQ